jgi:hypothetical protein
MASPYEGNAVGNEVTTDSLEERRLALEERKAQQDYEIKMLELSLKRVESGWLARLFTPLTTTVFAGILTLAASAVGTLMQANSTLQLEREKFDANKEIERQKEQHELILKMVSVGNEEQARANLKFLAESKLIDKDLANAILALKNVPVLPSNTGTRSDNRAFQAVRTDDEAVELIISWEGGYSFSPGTDPSGTDATNTGITIQALSEYLGRQATPDELKNLPKTTIVGVFKKRFLAPAEGIKNQLVRTAFLNISVWNGPNRAMQLFQTAAGRVLGKDIVPDGILGPMSISLINSAPDPDLLVETADCLLIESLKKSTAYRELAKAGSSAPARSRPPNCMVCALNFSPRFPRWRGPREPVRIQARHHQRQRRISAQVY